MDKKIYNEENIITKINNLFGRKIVKEVNSEQLIEMLRKEISNKEICQTLNIDNKKLYEELLKIKNMGINIYQKYYSDGTIIYKSISSIKKLNKEQEKTLNKIIITDTLENKLKFLVISDLHLGNSLERIDLLDRAYNYCKKNNINIILCGGDFVDGAYTRGNQNIKSLYEQFKYFLKNYPCDPDILTFGVAGNHDISSLNNASLNIMKFCQNYRNDIVIAGYNNAFINIKNDTLQLYHYIENGRILKSNAPIILSGHFHKYSTKVINNCLNITIPTLSDITDSLPSALELNLNFSNGYIKDVILKNIYFGNTDIILSEELFNNIQDTSFKNGAINNVEKYKSKKLF